MVNLYGPNARGQKVKGVSCGCHMQKNNRVLTGNSQPNLHFPTTQLECQDVFAAYDVNNDGKLSREEFRCAAFLVRIAQMSKTCKICSVLVLDFSAPGWTPGVQCYDGSTGLRCSSVQMHFMFDSIKTGKHIFIIGII